jgi:hypothetical protein
LPHANCRLSKGTGQLAPIHITDQLRNKGGIDKLRLHHPADIAQPDTDP